MVVAVGFIRCWCCACSDRRTATRINGALLASARLNECAFFVGVGTFFSIAPLLEIWSRGGVLVPGRAVHGRL
jgi:hypothetical protein